MYIYVPLSIEKNPQKTNKNIHFVITCATSIFKIKHNKSPLIIIALLLLFFLQLLLLFVGKFFAFFTGVKVSLHGELGSLYVNLVTSDLVAIQNL